MAVVVEEAAAAAGNPHFSKIRYLSGAPRSLGVAGTYNHMLSHLPFSEIQKALPLIFLGLFVRIVV